MGGGDGSNDRKAQMTLLTAALSPAALSSSLCLCNHFEDISLRANVTQSQHFFFFFFDGQNTFRCGNLLAEQFAVNEYRNNFELWFP